jgi:hypothetical protein
MGTEDSSKPQSALSRDRTFRGACTPYCASCSARPVMPRPAQKQSRRPKRQGANRRRQDQLYLEGQA